MVESIYSAHCSSVHIGETSRSVRSKVSKQKLSLMFRLLTHFKVAEHDHEIFCVNMSPDAPKSINVRYVNPIRQK